MKNRKKYKFIIDFDGTISVNDSTTTIARHFVPEMQKKYEERLHKKEISIAKYVQELLEASNLTEKTYIRFLEQNIVIDPTFKDFIKKGYDYTIVSAGAPGRYTGPGPQPGGRRQFRRWCPAPGPWPPDSPGSFWGWHCPWRRRRGSQCTRAFSPESGTEALP